MFDGAAHRVFPLARMFPRGAFFVSRNGSVCGGVLCAATRFFDFGDGFATALADRRIALVFADVNRVVPATRALLAFGLLNRDLEAGDRVGAIVAGARVEKIDLRNDEEAGKLRQILLQLGFELERSVEQNLRLETSVDFLVVARGLKRFQNFASDFRKL